MTPMVFEIIDHQRDYLREWLPFIDYGKHAGDTRSYILSLYDRPYDRRDMVFSIWYQGKVVGLMGLKGTDRDNHKTRDRLLAFVRYAGQRDCHQILLQTGSVFV